MLVMTQQAFHKLKYLAALKTAGFDEAQAQTHFEQLDRELGAEIARSVAELRAPRPTLLSSIRKLLSRRTVITGQGSIVGPAAPEFSITNPPQSRDSRGVADTLVQFQEATEKHRRGHRPKASHDDQAPKPELVGRIGATRRPVVSLLKQATFEIKPQ
jgi:hypothetical protein